MKHGSLFSGIGGFDLAAEWMGWENVFHCEWNDFGKKILHYYWPNAIQYDDITKTDFTIHRGQIDILTGGFPCQPYSTAGKRLGKEDERHLWPHMLRAIQEIQPRWVVGENVLGLVNWDDGLVFQEVCADLEAQGYEVQPFVLPAASKGAPHSRQRVWFIAYSNSNERWNLYRQKTNVRGKNQTHNGATNYGSNGDATDTELKRLEGYDRQWEGCTEHRGNEGVFFGTETKFNATNSNSNGLNKCDSNNEINSSEGWQYAQRDIEQSDVNGDATNTTSTGGGQDNRKRESRFNDKKSERDNWLNFPTQPPICGGDDGLPTELDGITFPKWRAESIKGYGNAIVPQVAYEIFKQL